MSDLDLATLLAHLAVELGDMPVEIVKWTPPLLSLGKKPQPRLCRAVERLAGGGMLAVQVQAGLRETVDPDEAWARLLVELEGLGVDVQEVQPVAVSEGLVLLVQLVAPAPEPPELDPVVGAAIYDLDPHLVDALARHAAPDDLERDQPRSRAERALIKLGAAVEQDFEVVPTVAGLVGLGRSPSRFLGGMGAVVHGGDDGTVLGSIESLPQRVVRALHLAEPAADGLRPLVVYALAHRSWAAGDRDEPLVVLAEGGRVEVRWPEAADGGNWQLVELLRLRRVDPRALDLGRLATWLRRQSGKGPSVVRVGGEVRAEIVLPRVNLHGPPRRPLKVTERPRECASRPEARHPAPVVDAAPVKRTTAAASTEPADVTPFMPADTRDAEVLALAEARGPITTRDVIESLGWTRSTTRDVLARLVRDGSLRRVAALARSPGQAYSLASANPSANPTSLRME